MNLWTWFLFFLTETALSFVPGPAVLFVIGTGLRRGLKPSIGANLGVLSANTIYFVASAAGLGVALAHARPLFTTIQYLGAAYLVWLGIASFRAAAAATGTATTTEDPQNLGAHLAANDSGNHHVWRAYRTAVLLQLGNPKAILFFTALVPQFVRPDEGWSVPVQIAVLGVTSVVSEFFVLLGYGLLAARAAAATRDPRLLQTVERASGACLIGCAALALAA
jgi:threonine/homoserine/homoserine lactone efflux protein